MSEEVFDLYDLDDALIEPLQEEVEKKAAEERAKLIKDENFREETEKIISQLKTSNFQLKKNISLLLATAKSEIERKDQQIKDLRREMDEIIFRKNKGTTKTLGTKLSEKWTQTDKVESHDNQKMQSNRHNESNKQYDKHKPLDYNKRRQSPERKYSDDYRRSSNRDEGNDRSRKSNYERKSPDRHDRYDKRSSQKESLREVDLRKVLLKNKTEEKTDVKDRRDKSSSRDDKKIDKETKQKSKERSSSRDDKKSREKSDIKEPSDKSYSHDDKVTRSKEKSKKKDRDRSRDKEKSKKYSTDRKESTKIDKSSKDKVDVDKKNKLDESKNSEASKSKSAKNDDKPEPCEKSTVVQPMELKIESIEIFKSNLNLSAESDDLEKLCDVQKAAPVKIDIEESKPIENSLNTKLDSEPINGCESIEEQLLKLESVVVEKEEPKIIFDQHISTNNEPVTATETSITITKHEEDQSTETEEISKQENLDIPENGDDGKINLSIESTESTKENSLNNSVDANKSKKRKIVTTEIESDGTVVWTITRKKRKTKEQN